MFCWFFGFHCFYFSALLGVFSTLVWQEDLDVFSMWILVLPILAAPLFLGFPPKFPNALPAPCWTLTYQVSKASVLCWAVPACGHIIMYILLALPSTCYYKQRCKISFNMCTHVFVCAISHICDVTWKKSPNSEICYWKPFIYKCTYVCIFGHFWLILFLKCWAEYAKISVINVVK